ncbi:SLAP domain-containing protein [Brevibacillus fulvus]|uniref:SLAP domain-containing protein n=1 Tax=Brevibacillus fulvus TaxID=1125967 RepID=UPI001EF94BAD|nr:SLAP domain-containing protein [Brevibacillus fulvus]
MMRKEGASASMEGGSVVFSFLRNWINKDKQELKQEIQEQSTVETEKLEESQMELEGTTAQKQTANKSLRKVTTELSLHPAWEQHLDAEKKYTLRFLQAELPAMIEGTVGVAGFSLIPQEGGVTVAMFFRNASAFPAKFKNVGLSIHLDNKPFARHQFNLEELGSIPPYHSRPWEVFFPQDSFLHDNFSFKRWQVLLKFGKHVWPSHLDLDPEMEERMTEKQKDHLEELAKSLPVIPAGTVDFHSFYTGKTEKGELVVGLLFRNGMRKIYKPNKLRLRLKDAQGDTVVSGIMDTTHIRVLPGTSRPWLVVFPPEMVKKADADLSACHAEVSE